MFVPVGMLEHVGASDYPPLGHAIDRSLTEHGRGLLHFIGRDQPSRLNPWIRKRIFPGAYASTLREVFEHVLEPPALSVVDVENLSIARREDAGALAAAVQRVGAPGGGDVRRDISGAWELYLAGSQAAFSTGSMQLFQVLLGRGTSNAVPWMRISG